MSVFTVVYDSKAIASIDSDPAPEIEQILTAARHSNAERGIRGALLWTEGRFVQMLEGEKPVVESTFDRILADSRHHKIEVRCTQAASKPRFADRSIAFVGDAPTLRKRFADAPLADLASEASGDALLDFMLDIARSPD